MTALESFVAPTGSARLGASGGVWTLTGSRVDAEGVKVIEARNDNGYPSDFHWCEWQTMNPTARLYDDEDSQNPKP